MSENQVPTINNNSSGNSHTGSGRSNFGISIRGSARYNISNNSHNNTSDSVSRAQFGVTVDEAKSDGRSKKKGGKKRGQSPSSTVASRTPLPLTKDDVGVPPAHCSYTSGRKNPYPDANIASEASLEETRLSENKSKHVDKFAKSPRQLEMAIEPKSPMASEPSETSAASVSADVVDDLASWRSSATLAPESVDGSTVASERDPTPVESSEIREPEERETTRDGNIEVASKASSVNGTEREVEEDYDMVNRDDLP